MFFGGAGLGLWNPWLFSSFLIPWLWGGGLWGAGLGWGGGLWW